MHVTPKDYLSARIVLWSIKDKNADGIKSYTNKKIKVHTPAGVMRDYILLTQRGRSVAFC